MARALPLLLVLAALAGCSATRRSAPDVVADAAPDVDERRVERLARTTRDLASADTGEARLDVGLSTRDQLGAWSWPDGRIRVGRALVDTLDDDELRAAIAHEIGHLIDAGALVGGARALAGTTRGGLGRQEPSGIETRADALACALLHAHGADVAALPRMLRTVASRAAADDDTIDRAQLLARARVAERACAPPR